MLFRSLTSSRKAGCLNLVAGQIGWAAYGAALTRCAQLAALWTRATHGYSPTLSLSVRSYRYRWFYRILYAVCQATTHRPAVIVKFSLKSQQKYNISYCARRPEIDCLGLTACDMVLTILDVSNREPFNRDVGRTDVVLRQRAFGALSAPAYNQRLSCDTLKG